MSRESVVWSDHTRNFLIKRFKEAVEEATKMVEGELQSTDILEWLQKADSVKSSLQNGGNRVLSQLSRVIDTQAISPQFNNTGIKFTNPYNFFRGIRVRYTSYSFDPKLRKNVISRHELKDWYNFKLDNIYLKSEATSTKTDHYLLSTVEGFLTIELMTDEQCEKEYLHNDVQSANISEQYYAVCMKARDYIFSEIKKSKHLKNYDKTVVPDEFAKTIQEAEEKEEELAMSAAEKRKLLGKIPVHTMVRRSSYQEYTYDQGQDPKSTNRPYTFTQSDEAVSDLIEFEGEIIYGFNDDTPQLMLLGQILHPQYKTFYKDKYSTHDAYNCQFNNKDLRIIRISKSQEKHFKNNDRFKHVSSFFQEVEDCN